jgi:tyrosyl-tRNA synthetase
MSRLHSFPLCAHKCYDSGRNQLDNLFNQKRIGAYVGIDPTAPSLHVGHMIPLMALFWLYLHGFQAVTLIGGSTAQIGDPTGRSTMRDNMDLVERKANITKMQFQLKAMWEHVEALGRENNYNWHRYWKRAVLNNNVWLNKVSVQEILKTMGGGLRMGSLLSRDS